MFNLQETYTITFSMLSSAECEGQCKYKTIDNITDNMSDKAKD